VGSSFLPEACIALGCLVNQAGLRRRESVLDIGCGLGRLAYLLSGYLLPSARYEGLEPVKRWVRRNRKLLTARFHNFHFCEFPVRHAIYNPRGKLDPATARFPCARASFDLAFATSVFQHNRGRVARNYLAEIARVLRPGGRALISCFLLDAQPGQTRAGRRGLEFSHPLGDCWTADPRRPETGIAFLERDFYQWAAEHGLAVHARWKGRWRSPGPGKLFQDLLVLTKANRARHLSGAAQRMRLP
jgi:SAM-dependent methyltransferase